MQLSGTFSENANVYPEVLFDDVRLLADLVNVSSDGIMTTMKQMNFLFCLGVLSLRTEAVQSETIVSMSLFGRVYSEVIYWKKYY